MTLTLVRSDKRPDGIVSKLYDDDQSLLAVTLEHSYDGEPKLPNGSYSCVRGVHQLSHGPAFETFEVMGVPHHTGILFHVGNYQADSDGCILLGRTSTESARGYMVTTSALTFARFMDLLDGIEEFTLRVQDVTEV